MESEKQLFHQGARVLVDTPNGSFAGTVYRLREYRKKLYLLVRREQDGKIYTVPASYCIYLSALN